MYSPTVILPLCQLLKLDALPSIHMVWYEPSPKLSLECIQPNILIHGLEGSPDTLPPCIYNAFEHISYQGKLLTSHAYYDHL